jgi:Xaa-Pro aminopeptidase
MLGKPKNEEIIDMEPHFSDGERQRRRQGLLHIAKGKGCAGVLGFGENKSGVAVTYLTEWPVTRGAIFLLTKSELHLWVSFHNHIPAAKRRAQVDSIRDIAGDYLQALFQSFHSGDSVGTLGPVSGPVRKYASEQGFNLVALDMEHAEYRLIKSVEEIHALELGAQATDIGATALINACRVGASDWDLLAAAKAAYTAAGALDHICYISITDMDNPDRDVPSQFPEGRVISRSSMITFEISASAIPEYPGQILRTIVMSDPTEAVMDLSELAEECKEKIKSAIKPGVTAAELIDISGMIEQRGYTTTDDLFHGFGMGYLEPVATSRSRVPVHAPQMTLEEGMAIVVQPNVTTVDFQLGVQTGELIIVDKTGARDLHSLSTGLVRI